MGCGCGGGSSGGGSGSGGGGSGEGEAAMTFYVKRILIFVIFVICEPEVGLLVHKLSSPITKQ